ncbi:MAG: hypothetical protein GX951_01805 [Mollicutes bacterium]|nr:hypothetical protein [Mollicutes bacterium]
MNKENKPKLILLAGPSGAGKTSVEDYLVSQYGVHPLMFITTRKQREDDNPNLFKHVSIEEYEARQKKEQFIFSFGSHDNRYAVNYDEINCMIKLEKDMSLTISYKNYYKILESKIVKLIDIQLIVLTMHDLYNCIIERLLFRNSSLSSEEIMNRVKYAFHEHEQYFDDISRQALCTIFTDNCTVEETRSLVSSIVYPEGKILKLRRK